MLYPVSALCFDLKLLSQNTESHSKIFKQTADKICLGLGKFVVCSFPHMIWKIIEVLTYDTQQYIRTCNSIHPC